MVDPPKGIAGNVLVPPGNNQSVPATQTNRHHGSDDNTNDDIGCDDTNDDHDIVVDTNDDDDVVVVVDPPPGNNQSVLVAQTNRQGCVDSSDENRAGVLGDTNDAVVAPPPLRSYMGSRGPMSLASVHTSTTIDASLLPSSNLLSMSIRADNGVRQLGRIAGAAAFDLADSINAITHIDGMFSDATLDSYGKDGTISQFIWQVYWYKHGDKFGTTSNLPKRVQHYIRKQLGLSHDKTIPKKHGVDVNLVPVFSLDNCMDESSDAQAKAIVQDLQLQILLNEDFPYALRELNCMLLEDGAAGLGFSRRTFQQLVEIGCQDHFQKPHGRMMEFLMCDQQVLDKREAYILAATDSLWAEIRLFLTQGVTYIVICLSSWNTGAREELLSSKIVATEALGCQEWYNTLPEPAVPDATTAEEIFSTDFEPEAFDKALRVLQSHVQNQATVPKNTGKQHILFLDTNNIVFDYHKLKLESFLVFYGFERKKRVFGGNLNLYVHHVSKEMIITHRPLCIAGDSRPEIACDQSIQRGLEAGVLQQVSFRIQNLPCLPQACPTHDFVVAGACYEMSIQGYHLSRRIAAVMFRNALTDENAIKASRLRASGDDKPLTRNLRNASRAYKEKAEREYDAAIIACARNMVSQVKHSKEFDNLGDKLQKLFKNVSSKVESQCWRYLFDSYDVTGNDACQAVVHVLKEQRERLRENVGNASATGLTLDMKDMYELDWNRALDGILGADDPAHHFWCHEAAAQTDKEKQARYTSLPDECENFPVVKLMNFDGIRTRVNTMNGGILQKKNTRARKVKVFPTGIRYGLYKEQPRQWNSEYPQLTKCFLLYKGDGAEGSST